ncbi:uncharacterized protein LOC117316502 [Pecten maximus]|uniref:uncharacterized protein LOC117316502 n=1 Tax=Pecten maximus TaxID=6579 RepID=UPI001458F743|nr:uncharacterized protein LOC117316502 [Pecten maximus]
MGCIHSKFAKKRKKKSKYQERCLTEQNATQRENRKKFSKRKNKNTENGYDVINVSSRKCMQSTFATAQDDVNELTEFLQNNPKDKNAMRNIVTTTSPRRKRELEFRRRKLYTVFILAILTFLHYMRMKVLGVRVVVSREDIAFYLLLQY